MPAATSVTSGPSHLAWRQQRIRVRDIHMGCARYGLFMLLCLREIDRALLCSGDFAQLKRPPLTAASHGDQASDVHQAHLRWHLQPCLQLKLRREAEPLVNRRRPVLSAARRRPGF